MKDQDIQLLKKIAEVAPKWMNASYYEDLKEDEPYYCAKFNNFPKFGMGTTLSSFDDDLGNATISIAMLLALKQNGYNCSISYEDIDQTKLVPDSFEEKTQFKIWECLSDGDCMLVAHGKTLIRAISEAFSTCIFEN